MSKNRVTVRVEELTLTNTLQLTAIVELLEERGILAQETVGAFAKSGKRD